MNKLILYFLLFLMINPAMSQLSGGLPPIIKKSQPPKSISEDELSLLINEGWQNFIGKNGFVDEYRALELTKEAVDIFINGVYPDRLGSIAWNNLTVIRKCAFSAAIRNYDGAFAPRPSAIKTGNSLSVDNLIWNFFYRERELADEQKFLEVLRRDAPYHPVVKFVEKVGGRLPDSLAQAYTIIEGYAADGNPDAALQMAFRFECHKGAQSMENAMYWYKRTIDLGAMSGDGKPGSSRLQDRFNRAKMIVDGKYRK